MAVERAGHFDGGVDGKSKLERLWQRVYRSGQSALEKVFGEKHDLFVNTAGMTQLSKGTDTSGTESTTEVTCHHFEYFTNDSAVRQLADKL